MSESANSQSLVLFRMEGQRYALRLDAVERVIRAVAVTPVPEAPPCVLGLINIAGRLQAAVSLRACLGLPDRPIRPEDQLVLARTSRLPIALVVDEAEGLSEVDVGRTVAVGDALPGGECRVDGLVKIDGDIILIYDLERLLEPEDQDRIVQAMAADGT